MEIILQTVILLTGALGAWYDLKLRVTRVEDECRRTNGRVTRLERRLKS